MLILSGLLAGVFAMHVKDQFADPRSHMMPEFRRIHMTVATIVMLILAAILTTTLAWSSDQWCVGVIAVTVLLFGANFWAVLRLSNWIFWPFLAIFCLGFSDFTRDAVVFLAFGQFEAQAFGLLAMGGVLVLLAGVRMFRLNEDMPDYHRRMPARWAAKGRWIGSNMNFNGPMPRSIMDWFRARAMADLIWHVRTASHSSWSRVCRWQIGMPTGWRVWLWGIVPIALQQFRSWQISRATSTGAPVMFDAGSLTMLPTIFAITQAMGWLAWRNQMLEYEMMLPVDRRSFVRQSSVAFALAYFQMLGAIVAGTIFWWLIAAPQTPPLAYLGSVLALSFFTQVGLFGVMVFIWTLTRLRAMQLAGVIICTMASVLFVQGSCRDYNTTVQPGAMSIAAGIAALGMLFAYIAYCRCSKADVE
jgi:hypothetical protein